MKHFISLSAFSLLALACSAPDRTEIEKDVPPEVERAPLIDTLQWNGERLSFYEVADEEGGGEVALEIHASNQEPELLLALERQLGRGPSAAEVWLAAGGEMEDVPAELLRDHVAQAAEEGRDAMLERPVLDVALVEEKAVSQAIFNRMFPLNSDATGVFPGTPSGCWDALATQVALGFTGKRVCSASQNSIGTWNGLYDCSTGLNFNGTIRTGALNFIGLPALVMNCFSAGNNPLTCGGLDTLGPNAISALSFLKNGTKHRLGTGVISNSTSQDTTVILGSAIFSASGVPAFQSTTCVQH